MISVLSGRWAPMDLALYTGAIMALRRPAIVMLEPVIASKRAAACMRTFLLTLR